VFPTSANVRKTGKIMGSRDGSGGVIESRGYAIDDTKFVYAVGKPVRPSKKPGIHGSRSDEHLGFDRPVGIAEIEIGAVGETEVTRVIRREIPSPVSKFGSPGNNRVRKSCVRMTLRVGENDRTARPFKTEEHRHVSIIRIRANTARGIFARVARDRNLPIARNERDVGSGSRGRITNNSANIGSGTSRKSGGKIPFYDGGVGGYGGRFEKGSAPESAGKRRFRDVDRRKKVSGAVGNVFVRIDAKRTEVQRTRRNVRSIRSKRTAA
jgi:hypothetical protein